MTVGIELGGDGSKFFPLVVGSVGLGQSVDGWVGSGHTKWTHGQLLWQYIAPLARQSKQPYILAASTD